MTSVIPTDPPADLFPGSAYDLPIPKVDGKKADKLVLSIGGTIELDRTDQDDLDLIEALELGRDTTLTVAGTVAAKGFAFKATDDDEATTFQVKVRVHTVNR